MSFPHLAGGSVGVLFPLFLMGAQATSLPLEGDNSDTQCAPRKKAAGKEALKTHLMITTKGVDP